MRKETADRNATLMVPLKQLEKIFVSLILTALFRPTDRISAAFSPAFFQQDHHENNVIGIDLPGTELIAHTKRDCEYTSARYIRALRTLLAKHLISWSWTAASFGRTTRKRRIVAIEKSAKT
jgi:hypothetical protein